MAKSKRRRRGPKEMVNFWDGIVFKLSTKILLGIFIAVVILTLIQCTVRSPEAPSWNTTFTVPMINRIYDMPELIDKIGAEELGIDSNNVVYMSFEETVDPVGLEPADFVISDVNHSFAQMVGPLNIDPPSMLPVTASLISITSLATAMPGDSALVVPTDFSVFNDIPTITEFSQANIASATMRSIVDNGLGVDIDSVEVRIFDRVFGVDVVVDTFPNPIVAGQTDTLISTISDLLLSNRLRIDVFAFTPGGIVQQFSTRYIGTELVFDNPLVISNANAIVPQQDTLLFSQGIALNLASGESIVSADVTSGQLSLDFVNATALGTEVQISFPALQNGGSPLVINQPLNANSQYNNNIDLTGYVLVPQSDSVPVQVSVNVLGSGGQYVPVNETDSFVVDASLSGLSFDRITGAFPSKEIAFDAVEQALDVPDGFDEIGIVSAALTLTVENGLDVPGNLACTLLANNGNQLVLTGLINESGGQELDTSVITNPDVGTFLSPLPDSVTIRGNVSFGNGSVHTINNNDSVFAKVSIYAPLNVQVNNAYVRDIDIERSEINQDDIDIVVDHVEQARFVYTFTNHLPLGITAIISMGGDSTGLYTNPELVLDTIYIDPAPVSLVTGITIADSVTTGEILLDNADIQVLRNAVLFVRPELYLNGSDPSGVLLTGDDYFTMNGRIEVEYLFDGNF